MANTDDNQTAVAIPVDVWVGPNASLAIPVAGLLASKPELAAPDVTKTPEQWQKLLDTYNTTLIDPEAKA